MIRKTSIKKQYIHSFVQYLFLIALAITIWKVYYPGLFSPDSIGQVIQAHTGVFDDAHPPFMSLVLWIVLKFGAEISTLILIQCLFALFGLRAVVLLSLQFFSSNAFSKSVVGAIATTITAIFLVPFISPFMFFSIIFWKDAWVTIILLWVLSYLIWIYLNSETLHRKHLFVHISLISLLTATIVITRHNAVVVVPAFALTIALIGKLKFGRLGVAVAVIPLVIGFSINPITKLVFNVVSLHFVNSVYASDLKVMLDFYPHLESKYPLTARHKNSPIFLDTKQGGVWDESIEGEPCPVIDCVGKMPQECYGTTENTRNINGTNCYMPTGTDNKRLKAEYFRAMTTNPLELTYTKFRLYLKILDPTNMWRQKIAYDIYQNQYNLELNNDYKTLRDRLNELSATTSNKWYFVWFSGIHLLWLLVNIVFIFASLIMHMVRRRTKDIFLFSLCLIPLFYYASYFVAATTPDYRFMYPSTLIMQVLSVSVLISWWENHYRAKRKAILNKSRD